MWPSTDRFTRPNAIVGNARAGRLLTSAVLACLGASASALAAAPTYKVLTNFAGSDGSNPFSALAAAPSGTLYGTTNYGGAANLGVVFSVTPPGKITALYSFKGGNDGANPVGPLAYDAAGNLYGTTYQGGAAGLGTVFKLAPDGTETVLHSFAGGQDGANPASGILRSKAGTLYGTTDSGGGNANFGTVFTIDAKGRERILHGFTGQPDGRSPNDGLVLDAKGNLFGTTVFGGVGNTGSAFEIAADGKEKVIYSFSADNTGDTPANGLTQDAAGNLYGTTLSGGTTFNGVIYKLTPAGKEMVLYSFTGGNDGSEPRGVLVRDKAGNLFGVAGQGGAQNYGEVFKLTPAGKLHVLHSFAGGSDGDTPLAGLTADRPSSPGYLYGTTAGLAQFPPAGTVFRVPR